MRSVIQDKNHCRRDGGAIWRRPLEIMDEPEIFISDADDSHQDRNNQDEYAGVSAAEIVHGYLETNTFAGSLAVVAADPKRVYQLLITDCVNPIGIYGMVLFDEFIREWRVVFVDDQFVCTEEGELAFGKSTTPNELWVGLIEKCFAKFIGGFDNIKGMTYSQGLQILAGGEQLTLHISDTSQVYGSLGVLELYTKMKAFFDRGYVMGLSAPKRDAENVSVLGLVAGDAYTVTNMRRVGVTYLVQLQNPFADSEWEGMFYIRIYISFY